MLDRPPVLLRLEETCILIAACLLYHHFHFGWLLFAVLFFTPDLFMLGFLVNPRAGASLYNLGHTLTIPIPLFLVACATHHPLAMAIALIWISHIAFDRMLGYGLKYPTFFKDTHLQHIA
jgi:hypothetical protein